MENTCKNCGRIISTPFCGHCGEKVYGNDRSFGKVFNEAFHFITHFEGTFFTTLKAILFRPGKVSTEYCSGVRKKYFKPVSFFLFIVILYLVFPMFEGLNMKLRFHLSHNTYGLAATEMVNNIMESRNISMETITDIFQQKSEKVSKFLLFILLPAMAFISWMLAFRKRKYFFDHFIFSTESNSFFILWGYLLVPVLYSIVAMISRDLLPGTEMTTGVVIVSVYLIWFFIAAKRFFRFSILYTILYIILYIIGLVLFTENVYKYLLFNITIRMI